MMAVKPLCEVCPVRLQGVFSDLTKDEQKFLTKAKTCNAYRKRSVIFYEGNPSMGLFCVNSGKVKIFKNGVEGQVQIVRLAKPGDLLGYRALLANEPYAAPAEVLEDATICFMDRTTVFQLLQRNATLSLRILRSVCQDLRTAEERTLDLIQKPVAQRVAALLLALQASFGENAKQGVRLNIALTREEMAEMVGTTAETLIRTLSDFKTRGLVELEPHAVFVRKPHELARLLPADS